MHLLPWRRVVVTEMRLCFIVRIRRTHELHAALSEEAWKRDGNFRDITCRAGRLAYCAFRLRVVREEPRKRRYVRASLGLQRRAGVHVTIGMINFCYVYDSVAVYIYDSRRENVVIQRERDDTSFAFQISTKSSKRNFVEDKNAL